MKRSRFFAITLLIFIIVPTVFFNQFAHSINLQKVRQATSSLETITPLGTSSSSLTTAPTETTAPTPSIDERLRKVEEEITSLKKAPKDVWDKISAVSSLITGGIVALIGIIATYLYNERQRTTLDTQKQNELKILQVQTLHSFMPQLQSKIPKVVEGAILAIKALGNDDLALKVGELFKSEGSAAALSKIASSLEPIIAQRAQSILLDELGAIRGSIVQVLQKDNLGAGFIISTDGYIATPYHVISNIKSGEGFRISYMENIYSAEVVAYDPESDLAILRIPRNDLPALPLLKDARLNNSSDVVIIGQQSRIRWVVRTGRVIRTDAQHELIKTKLISTDVEVSHEFSGVPAVTPSGLVIGMVVASYVPTQRELPSHTLLLPASIISSFARDRGIITI